MSGRVLTCLPEQVHITEICPRDGLQSIEQWIPTEDKLQVIDALLATGVKQIEATSFVSPKAIPQMADAMAVAQYAIEKAPEADVIALVPNVKGAELAAKAGLQHINYVISASIEHNLANIRRTHEASLEELQQIRAAFPMLRVTLSLATSFGCPFLGAVPVTKIQEIIHAVQDCGIEQVTLCDTIGVATPKQVDILLATLRQTFPTLDFGMHMHDTHGLALANTLVGLQHGITRFETAAAGLGGCPFAPGATGNSATEDLVNMLERMGIATGLDLERYIEVAKTVRRLTASCGSSHLAGARPYTEFSFYTQEK